MVNSMSLEESIERKPRIRRSRTPITLPASGDGLIADRAAAAALSIGRSTFWRLVASGKLRPVKIGSATRFRISDVRGLIASAE